MVELAILDDFDFLMFPVIGVAIALSYGAMSSIIPFMFAILAWLVVLFSTWKGISVISFVMYGFTMGATVGAMANIVPYAFVILGWGSVFLTLMIRPRQEIRATTWIMTPLILMVIGGLAYVPYPLDFINSAGVGCTTPSNVCNGYPDNWQGCISSCLISAPTLLITLFSASFFKPLLSGDIVGFFASLFQAGGAGIFGFLAVIAGIILTFLALGIGGTASILGSGVSFSESDSGTRMAQSMGITLLAYGLVTLSFGSWFSILGGGWFGLDTILPIVFASITFYGGYLQGKYTGGTG